MRERLKEEMSLLAIGTIVTCLVGVGAFLLSTWSSSFVAKADYNYDRGDIKEIKVKLNHIASEQDRVRKDLEWIKNNLYRNGQPIKR